jgi:large-conductance mechanosensitive channel
MVNCHASNKGLFAGMIAFSCTMISIILYAVFRKRIGDTTHMTETHPGHSHPILPNTTTAIIATIHHPSTSISKALKQIDYSIVILEIVNLCLLALSLFATVWSLIKIRKLNYRRTTTRERYRRTKHLSTCYSSK